MATSGEKSWPPVGNLVAASGEKQMAIDRGPRSEVAGVPLPSITDRARPLCWMRQQPGRSGAEATPELTCRRDHPVGVMPNATRRAMLSGGADDA